MPHIFPHPDDSAQCRRYAPVMQRAGIDSGTSRRWALVLALVLLALALRLASFAPFDISHADELMQYLEQGNRLATGQGIVPWESRYDVRNGLLPQLLAVPLWLGHAAAPGTLAAMLLARLSFMAACLAGLLAAAWRLGGLVSGRHALAALFVAASWYESVVFGDLLLSESLSTSLLLLATALLLNPASSRRVVFFAGLLLGLGVLVRLQYAVFAGVLVIAALRLNARRWAAVIAGGVLALVIGAASDLVMGHAPFGWIAMNFTMNITAGRAARFSASGPFEYCRLLLLHLGPAALLILLGAVLAGARYRPLQFAALANLLAHSLIAHKEYRFIWLSVMSALLLAAVASLRLIDHVVARRQAGKPADGRWLVLLCAVWLGLSFAAEAQSGGARAMRGGGAIPRMALVAARLPATCGIGIPDQWRAHLVPALLPRPLPLYVAPAAVMAQNIPLPPALTGAANALVLPELPPGSTGYRQVACETMPVRQACLYIRAGSCTPASGWSYQRALEREDL